MIEVKTISDAVGNLGLAARKLQGVARLLFVEEPDRDLELSGDQASGISYILEQIAEEISTNADLIGGLKS